MEHFSKNERDYQYPVALCIQSLLFVPIVCDWLVGILLIDLIG